MGKISTLKNVIGVEVGKVNASNGTTNYNLPLFVATDKPSWLLDWNGAMTAIDSLLKQVSDNGSTSESEIEALKVQVKSATKAIDALTETTTKLTENVSTLNTDVTQAKQDIETMQGTVLELSATVKELSTNVTSLSTDYDKFKSSVIARNSTSARVYGNSNGTSIDVSNIQRNAGALVAIELHDSSSNAQEIGFVVMDADSLYSVGTSSYPNTVWNGNTYDITVNTVASGSNGECRHVTFACGVTGQALATTKAVIIGDPLTL